MKLLLDQGLPRNAATLLTAAGMDTVHVGDLGHSTAEDAAILHLGRDDGHIVVTLDADVFYKISAEERIVGVVAIGVKEKTKLFFGGEEFKP